MLKQFLLTMRSEFASRYRDDERELDGAQLLRGFRSARLIGAPGYSMRVVVEQDEVRALKKALSGRFIIEPDHVLHTFSKRPGRRLMLGRRVERRV
jgi:hypothetical protein